MEKIKAKAAYALYELEPKVIKMISDEKKNNGVNKDFTVNKAIQFFFKNRTNKKMGGYDYEFNPKGRGRVYIYVSLKNAGLLNTEKSLKTENFNTIINTAVKFYIKNK
jgi:hypothetical protein